MESKIPKSTENPPKVNDYDEKGDLDEHMQPVNDRLSFFSADDVTK